MLASKWANFPPCKKFLCCTKETKSVIPTKKPLGLQSKTIFQTQWTQSKRMAFDVSMKWNTEVLLSAYIPCSSWCLPTSADVFMCWVLLWLKAVTRLKVAFSPWKYQTTAHTLYSHKSIVKSNLISIISYSIKLHLIKIKLSKKYRKNFECCPVSLLIVR